MRESELGKHPQRRFRAFCKAEWVRASVWRAHLSLLVLAALSPPASAHESRPLYIELVEIVTQQYQLQWKTPSSVAPFNIPTVALPESCQELGSPAEFNGPDGLIRRMSYRCPQGLAGHRMTILYPGPNPSVSSLIRFRTADGERHTAVLSPRETTWGIPHAETTSAVARQYTLLGVEHMWTGFDHLLFLVCLLWIASTWRRILITITGFTLAHSLTLILSALNVVRLPIPPVEAAIALSIVFLASEIARGTPQSLTWRYPIAVSASFGLLHGFGFAAALREVGLPQAERVTALLFFNVGVEIGQILFAASLIALLRLLQRLGAVWLEETHGIVAARTVASYAVGGLATFWLVERCAWFWPG